MSNDRTKQERREPNTDAELDTAQMVEGRYRIERELGRGAMGVVYEATDLGLGRRVALKVITRDLAGDASFVERFLREAKALASIHHQNVVGVHALGQHDQAYYYAMEFVQGRSLEAIMAECVEHKEPMPARDAFSMFRQVASGLSAVHAARIIHRDVKPANIVIERDTGRPVLIDFGIVRPAFNGSTRSTLLVGSPTYMAPEQIQSQNGTAELTPAADLYALGCVLYEMLTLRPPFDSNDVYEVLRDQVSRIPQPLSAHRPDLARFDTLIARLLAKRPEARPEGCLAVIRDLDRLTQEWESGRAVSVLPPRLGVAASAGAHVLVASDDHEFTERARSACGSAFRTAWNELGRDIPTERKLSRITLDTPALVILHCDSLDDGGVSFMTRLREMPAGSRTRVIAFGSQVDPLDRWRLGSLGVTEFHAPFLPLDLFASLLGGAAMRERNSGMPGPRLSTMLRPVEPATASHRVPVELFLLVLSCAWCEGALTTQAGLLVIDAARAEGLSPDAIAAIERACRGPIDLVDVDVSDLPTATRHYAYAFATWFALGDGVISQREESTLHVLAFMLGLSARERVAIQSIIEQTQERGSLATREGFRFHDFNRVIAPTIERVLRGQVPGSATARHAARP